MQRIHAQRAQSTAEYAVLFAIVIGAAIAMQQYVGGRLKGAVKDRADQYARNAHNGFGLSGNTFSTKGNDAGRNSISNSVVNLTMTNVRNGTVRTNANTNAFINKQ